VSNAAAATPETEARIVSHSRTPIATASGSTWSAALCLSAIFTPISRDLSVLMPIICVGPPTTSKSAPATASGDAASTRKHTTSAPADFRPSATASATFRLLPNKLSYTTTARIIVYLNYRLVNDRPYPNLKPIYAKLKT
jgi:hypothetical protein